MEQIEAAILSGELPVGSRLGSERELMVQFGVSRPTVREALRMLQSMDLLEPSTGTRGGPVVRAPSAETLGRSFRTMLGTSALGIAELVEFRLLLDGSACELAALRHTDAQLEAMRQAVQRMHDAAGDRSETFAEADLAFHETVWEASGNPILVLSGQAVWGALRELMQRGLERGSDSEDDSIQHASARIDHELFEAIRDRHAVEAGRRARTAIATRFMPLLEPEEQRGVRALLDGERSLPTGRING